MSAYTDAHTRYWTALGELKKLVNDADGYPHMRANWKPLSDAYHTLCVADVLLEHEEKKLRAMPHPASDFREEDPAERQARLMGLPSER